MAPGPARALKGIGCVSGTARDGPAEFRGFVTVRAEDEAGGVLTGQLSPQEVRTMALYWLQVAEAAEQDAIVFTVMTRDIGLPAEDAAGLVRRMRDERAGD